MDNRLILRIAAVDRGRQQFDAVTVRIEQVDVVRMPQTVPARPKLNVITIPQATCDTASSHDFFCTPDDVCEMNKRGPIPPKNNPLNSQALPYQQQPNSP